MAKKSAKVVKGRRQVRVQPARLSNVVKIREIKAQLPNLLEAAGLRDTVALTVRNSFVAGVANCEFMLPFVVYGREDYVDYAPYAPPVNPLGALFGPALIVNLTVFHANKAHLLTIYIDSSVDQTYLLFEDSAAGNLLQTFEIESGPRTILFAFLPATRGARRFLFGPDRPDDIHTKSFNFSRVEIDVVR